MAEVLNAVAGKEVISQPIAVFAGCCFPVNAYFFYLIGNEALPKVYQMTNTQKNDSGLLLVLGFFLPMVAAMIVQGDVNKLYE